MDRYQIARKKKTGNQLYRFPSTDSIKQIILYVDHCRRKSASFMADNITTAVLETALVKISKLEGIPILVPKQEQARILSTVYSHRQIFPLENHVVDDLCSHSFSLAICYNCKPPRNIRPYIVVLDKAL